MLRFDPARFFLIGGTGVVTCVYLALIWLKPEAPPESIVKGAFVVFFLVAALFSAVVISQWIDYFRNR